MENLNSKIESLKKEALIKKHEYEFQKQAIEALEIKIKEVNKEIDILKKTDLSLKQLIELMNNQSIERAEDLVSEGLTQIFEKPFTFKIEISQKRGNMCFTPVLIENGRSIDILNSRGGGVADVVSILLRIITILIVKPKLKRVLLLDESLSQLSKEFVPRAAQFFKELGSRLGFTIVMVTHEHLFMDYADQVYVVNKVRGGADVKPAPGN